MRLKIFSVRPGRMQRKVISICVLSILLTVVLWGAVAPLFSVTVYALPPALLKARTIGELIVTLFAGAGTAVTNPTVVPAIYSNYNTSAYNFETLIDEGILQPVDQSLTTEQAVELLGSGNALQTPYNLDADAFRTYVSSNWSQMQDLGVDAVLRLNDIANTDSVYGAIDNLGQLVKDVANYGYLGSSNAIAVIANPGTVVKVGWQNILDAVKSKYGGNIEAGVNIETPTLSGYRNIGYLRSKTYQNYTTHYFYSSVEGYTAAYGRVGYGGFGALRILMQDGNTGEHIIYTDGSNDRIDYVNNAPAGTVSNFTVSGLTLDSYSGPLFSSFNEARDYLQGLYNGTIQKPSTVSPDVINQNQGNVTNLPDVNPAVPDGKGLEIIDGDTYNNYITTTNNNYINGIPEDNAIVTDDLIQDHLVEDTSQNEPDEPWQNPDIPGTNPINPDQPDLPDKPTLTPDEEIQALTPNADGIISVFPFCIPWDIYGFVKELNVPRKAPVINASIPMPDGSDYEIVIDLASYDQVASIARTLQLIIFIIGLAVITRELIGA